MMYSLRSRQYEDDYVHIIYIRNEPILFLKTYHSFNTSDEILNVMDKVIEETRKCVHVDNTDQLKLF